MGWFYYIFGWDWATFHHCRFFSLLNHLLVICVPWQAHYTMFWNSETEVQCLNCSSWECRKEVDIWKSSAATALSITDKKETALRPNSLIVSVLTSRSSLLIPQGHLSLFVSDSDETTRMVVSKNCYCVILTLVMVVTIWAFLVLKYRFRF